MHFKMNQYSKNLHDFIAISWQENVLQIFSVNPRDSEIYLHFAIPPVYNQSVSIVFLNFSTVPIFCNLIALQLIMYLIIFNVSL